jgi:hypothetical protein
MGRIHPAAQRKLGRRTGVGGDVGAGEEMAKSTTLSRRAGRPEETTEMYVGGTTGKRKRGKRSATPDETTRGADDGPLVVAAVRPPARCVRSGFQLTRTHARCLPASQPKYPLPPPRKKPIPNLLPIPSPLLFLLPPFGGGRKKKHLRWPASRRTGHPPSHPVPFRPGGRGGPVDHRAIYRARGPPPPPPRWTTSSRSWRARSSSRTK